MSAVGAASRSENEWADFSASCLLLCFLSVCIHLLMDKFFSVAIFVRYAVELVDWIVIISDFAFIDFRRRIIS